MILEVAKPELKFPFPNTDRYWKCPKTGLMVPKRADENVVWREKLLREAENDTILQADLMAACRESQLFWVNGFAWTYHQFDVNPETGEYIEAPYPHNPFITWEIQDELCDAFEWHLKHLKSILIDKCRDMGASWMCVNFMHWLWLFSPESQLLEMSRTQDYVDMTGNMKALFQKHDYINDWLPEWMVPPGCRPTQKHRTKMHMKNVNNGSVIDGESTTEHAGSGDRRKVILLDEFAKVEHGKLMRSATKDVSPFRIINSTPFGPGTEYSRWKNGGQIKVFILPFHEHPDKGAGRYVKELPLGGWEIRSPWLDEEEKVRTPQEMAQEILRQDIESGDVFFDTHSIDKHVALFACEPKCRMTVDWKKGIANDNISALLHRKHIDSIEFKKNAKGPLRVWCDLIMGRPDQTKHYIFGIDIGKGQGASNSVISIKCKETREKIAEWRDANTPPYELARICAALALWCGSRPPRKLPFLKWEMNGPGWDFGRIIVKKFMYPYYYRMVTEGKITEKKTDKYGWHAGKTSKETLLSLYNRLLAHGGYINHSKWGLDEARMYIRYPDGGVGPACMVEENASARKTHGDVVIADALTLEDSDIPKGRHIKPDYPHRSAGYRREMKRKKIATKKGFHRKFDFTRN